MFRVLLYLWLFALSQSMAQAQTIEDNSHIDELHVNPQLRLADVLQKAVARAPQQILLMAERSVVQAKQTVANSTLSASPYVTLMHQNDVLTSARNERDFMAQLALPLWMPNEKQNALHVANMSAEQLTTNTEHLQLMVAGALRESIWDVALNREMVAGARKQLENLKQIERAVDNKYQAGEAAKTDLMLIQQEVIAAQQQHINSQAELMHAHFAYTQLTGIDEIPASFKETLSSIEDYEHSAPWQSALAKVALAQSEKNLSITQRSNRPQLVLNARSSQGAFDDQYNQSLGLQVQIPLDTDVSRAPRLAEAEYALGEAMSQRDELRRRLTVALHEAEHNFSVSQQSLTLSEQQARLAEQNATLAIRAYELGEMDLIDCLRIKSSAYEAKKKLVTSQIAVQRDVARYNQAVGVLP